ncbi:TRAP transporter small permease subunit [Geminicoccaceae bacterium 1502E]|nr:TRAP transporter small permease subunit [Geminicoccaceae bacterium 1502E]
MTFLPRLASFSDAVDRAVTAICVVSILVMLGISFVGFFYMIITGAALSWTYSLARLFIPWLGLLSITVAFKRGEHIAMSSLLEILPTRLAGLFRVCNRGILLLFALMMVWFGMKYTISSTDYFMVSDQIQIHARFVTVVAPISGLILVIHVLGGGNLFDPPDLLEPDELNAVPAGRKADA